MSQKIWEGTDGDSQPSLDQPESRREQDLSDKALERISRGIGGPIVSAQTQSHNRQGFARSHPQGALD